MYAQLIVQAPLGPLTYRVPQNLADELAVGMSVRVPLGRRHTHGYVLQVPAEAPPADVQAKDIVAIDEERPVLPAALLELVMFASRYYCALPGDVLAVALPQSARTRRAAYRLTAAGRAAHAAPAEAPAGPPSVSAAWALHFAAGQPRGFTATALCRALKGERAACLRILRRLLSRGQLEAVARVAAKPRQEIWLHRLLGTTAALGPRQGRAARLLSLLPADGSAVSHSILRQRDAKALGAAATLLDAGLAAAERRDQLASPWGPEATAAAPPVPVTLSQGQTEALATIETAAAAGTFGAFLLQGITGSGKTEVYLRAIDAALRRGQTALVLVPEIALTPQLGARFRARFGARVATFHSGLSPAERRDEWERVATGQARIALGARSALFLPLETLGIVVVDEEHETSFKQDETPHYNARDLAIWRAKRAGVPVVLGSATPSLESMHNARSGRYTRLLMPTRPGGAALPAVDIIDLKTSPPLNDALLSEPLVQALTDTLSRGEQAILFLNRRGFAPYIFCRDCAHPFRCQHCEVALTLHRRQQQIVCHYCGHCEAMPDTCPMCGGHRVGAFGPGIERLEAELYERFAGTACVRLDRDSVRSRPELEKALDRFRSGRVPLLIGTQMVAKGHDFPGVTLVGAVAADASLNFPDFRAAERTFQLLTQVAGRAGRATLPGRVLIQAFETDHYAITAAAKHDFEGFAEHELAFRRELGYPPFAHLALLRFEGESFADVEAEAAGCASLIAHPGVTVLGPALAPLARLRGLHRVHVLLKAEDRAALRAALARSQQLRRPRQQVRRVLDVDPVNML